MTLRNERSEIRRMLDWVQGLVPLLRLPPCTAHALQLCLEEAVVNIISHAFEPGTRHDVNVAVWRDDVAVRAEVTDDGCPFDPLAYEPVAMPKDLATAQIGGLGIKLMRGFAKRISYSRSGSMNRLLLSF